MYSLPPSSSSLGRLRRARGSQQLRVLLNPHHAVLRSGQASLFHRGNHELATRRDATMPILRWPAFPRHTRLHGISTSAASRGRAAAQRPANVRLVPGTSILDALAIGNPAHHRNGCGVQTSRCTSDHDIPRGHHRTAHSQSEMHAAT